MNSFFNKYPELKKSFCRYPAYQNLLTKDCVSLSLKNFNTCVAVIEAFWMLRENNEYRKIAYTGASLQARHDPQHYSMLMCFDFHITPLGPKLIEINTNAAFSMLAWYLSYTYDCNIQKTSFDKLLKNMVSEESQYLGSENLNIAIIDEDLQNQKSFFEFKYFEALFKSWGHGVEICDTQDLSFTDNKLLTNDGEKINFVYNRCCDFLFEQPKHEHLKKAFLSNLVCFTPNPHEYNLLANKQRLIDVSKPEFLDSINIEEFYKDIIKNTVPRSFNITDFDLEKLKKIKSNYVFKPKKSYGSKAVYLGKSISNTRLSSIYNDNFMVQEYVPPSKINDFKYDLRIYVYKNEAQLALARLYKGQVTNTNTGGLARVILQD